MTREAPVMVPVLSSSNAPLMPCHPARARELLKKRKATKKWFKGIFCIKLIMRKTGIKQPIICGIDPGSKKEAFSVLSQKHTYLNVLSDAVTWVNKRIETRRMMRLNRRGRKTPCRKPKINRKTKLSPSTKSRWLVKLRIIKFLRRLYPISGYVVEDNKAITKPRQRLWNKHFSTIQTGKKFFFNELSTLGTLILRRGYETKELRESLGLIKSHTQTESFSSHNIDSWALANSVVENNKPNNLTLFRMIPLEMHRRQLHRLQPSKGNVRLNYGGTCFLNLKKGCIVRYRGKRYLSVGGFTKNRQFVALNDLQTGKRKIECALSERCELIYYSSFRTYQIK